MSEQNEKYQAEVDFKAIITDPTRWMGFVYLLSIAGIIAGGLYYIYNINYVLDNSIKYKSPMEARVWKDLDSKAAIELEGVDINALADATPELISIGKEAYAKNCLSCHGSEGKGDGVAGMALNPKPRNLTLNEGWKNGREFGKIYQTLEEGLAGTAMAAYEYLPVKERIAIIHFVRSLAEYPEIKKEELADLELNYSLSAGKKSAAQIPIAKANDLLIAESKESVSRVRKAYITLLAGPNKDAILNVVDNPHNAIAFILNASNKSSFDEVNRAILSGLPKNGFKGNYAKLDRNEAYRIYNIIRASLSLSSEYVALTESIEND